jgi:hypothetical protein
MNSLGIGDSLVLPFAALQLEERGAAEAWERFHAKANRLQLAD